MNFGHALDALRLGYKVERSGWNGAGQWVKLQVPDEHSKMTQPYLYMRNAQGGVVPWLASQGDVLGEDWLIVLDSEG